MVQFYSRAFSYEYVSYILYSMGSVAHRVGIGAVQASVVVCQHGHLEKIPKPALCTRSLGRVHLLSLCHATFPPPSTLLVDFQWSSRSPFPAFFARATLTSAQTSITERSVDPETGIIRTERVIGCTQKAPGWIVRVSRSRLRASVVTPPPAGSRITRHVTPTPFHDSRLTCQRSSHSSWEAQHRPTYARSPTLIHER